MRSFLALGLLAPLSLFAACDSSITDVDFSVESCPVGGGSCGAQNRLLIGTSTEVALGGMGKTDDLSGVELTTDTPDLIAVEQIEDGPAPRWRVTGLGAGSAHLIAGEKGGDEIERIDLDVGHIDSFHVVRLTLDDERVADRPGFDQVWTVRHDGFLDLSVVAEASTPTKGVMDNFAYEVEMDDTLRPLLHDHDAGGAPHGELFGHSLEPGEHPLTLTAPDGSTLRLLVIGI